MEDILTKQFHNSPLNKEVSWFSTIKGTTPTTVNLLQYLAAPVPIATVKLIERIRSVSDEDERRALKHQLPAITPSGKFTKRSTECIETHSGLISIDIDGKDNPDIDMSELKQELMKLPQVAYAAYSVSGVGLWALIVIAYPEKHAEHFDHLVQFFQRSGVILDNSGRDITRMRIQSYDPDALFNHKATPLSQFLEGRVSSVKLQRHSSPLQDNDSSEPYLKSYKKERLVKALLYMIIKYRVDITETQQKWFEVGCVLANIFNEKGRDYYHHFSRHYPRYSRLETDSQYNRCLHGSYNYGIGTLVNLCKEKGIEQFKDTITYNGDEDHVLI